tara:strand:- start:1507 stop:1767 length:261 start_codon:yes stop_codon:yes gene_type:complete
MQTEIQLLHFAEPDFYQKFSSPSQLTLAGGGIGEGGSKQMARSNHEVSCPHLNLLLVFQRCSTALGFLVEKLKAQSLHISHPSEEK